jgi:hypothetical protein
MGLYVCFTESCVPIVNGDGGAPLVPLPAPIDDAPIQTVTTTTDTTFTDAPSTSTPFHSETSAPAPTLAAPSSNLRCHA